MNDRALIPIVYLKNQAAVYPADAGQDARVPCHGGDAVALATAYENSGADALLIVDLSDADQDHEKNLLLLKEICKKTDIPVIGAGSIKRLEDVKKLLYAGCAMAVLDYRNPGNTQLTGEASGRFGREKIAAWIGDTAALLENRDLIGRFTSLAVLSDTRGLADCLPESPVPVLPILSEAAGLLPGAVPAGDGPSDEDGPRAVETVIEAVLSMESVCGVCGEALRAIPSMRNFKRALQEKGIPVRLPASVLSWNDFEKNSDGLLPVVVQDYETKDVLMMAYMNEKAFTRTVDTGMMTYFSRSRKKLWVKGETSGHYQYVKELRADCDSDTLLAKVNQIGAACHTGSRSCFFREVLNTGYKPHNPMEVLDSVYGVIKDRRAHPKEGSYTNYLFDKGVDKILKKLGEEAAEIIIAAKNPEPQEIIYEISDFLYHAMVLMVEKGVTWEEIMRELNDR